MHVVFAVQETKRLNVHDDSSRTSKFMTSLCFSVSQYISFCKCEPPHS